MLGYAASHLDRPSAKALEMDTGTSPISRSIGNRNSQSFVEQVTDRYP
jgi:hypothetical protein